MKPEHHKMVAQRLYEVLRDAPKGPAAAPATPSASLGGEWEVDVAFVAGPSRHKLVMEADGNRVTGTHYGRSRRGAMNGTIKSERVRLVSSLPFEGARLSYTFTGAVSADRMSGDLELGEYGRAQWKARKVG